MQNTKNKLLIILLSTLGVLVVIFGLSFISPYKNKTNNILSTALVNKKYEIAKININNINTGDLTLYYFTDFWGAEYFDGNNYIYFPVDSVKVNEFISKAQEIISLEKIKDAKSKNELEKYSVDKNITSVSFYNEEKCVSTVNFGAFNQSMDKVFLWTDKNMTVYAMNSQITYYIESGIKFWTDQNLIPQGISKNLDFSTIQNFTYKYKDGSVKNGSEEAKEKFASLRFSEIMTDFEIKDKELEINLADGNGSIYKYSFYPAVSENGECFVFTLEITPSMFYSENQKQFIKQLNYCGSISLWTYSTITGLLP